MNVVAKSLTGLRGNANVLLRPYLDTREATQASVITRSVTDFRSLPHHGRRRRNRDASRGEPIRYSSRGAREGCVRRPAATIRTPVLARSGLVYCRRPLAGLFIDLHETRIKPHRNGPNI